MPRRNLRIAIGIQVLVAFILLLIARTSVGDAAQLVWVKKQLGEALFALAEALLIAAILTATFESVVRLQLIRELDAARARLTSQIVRVLTHTQQPDPVLAAVEAQVLSKPIVRQKAEYTISLEARVADPHHLTLKAKTKSLLVNLTDTQQMHTVTKELTATFEDIAPASTKIVEMSAKKLSEDKVLFTYSGPGERKDEGRVVAHSQPIPLESHEIVEVEIWTEQVRTLTIRRRSSR